MDEQRVVTAYQGDATCREIAADIGCHEATIRRTLDRHNVRRRPPGSRPQLLDDEALVTARETEGLTWEALGLRFGLSWSGARKRYRRVLRQQGRSEPPRVPKLTAEETQQLRTAWRSYTRRFGSTAAHALLNHLHHDRKLPWPQLAAPLGVDEGTVRRVAHSVVTVPLEPTAEQRRLLLLTWRRYRAGAIPSRQVSQVLNDLASEGVGIRPMARIIGLNHGSILHRLNCLGRRPRIAARSTAEPPSGSGASGHDEALHA
ncbi:hypothetical protein [Streptomyces nanshensis]|uniref:hypothetical protein n=1 Tax=Streptomyces nanshensis TaxID=518642 RepID=UPI00114CCD0A|nr:hypothetical protein [Streptomyces nanshensis]